VGKHFIFIYPKHLHTMAKIEVILNNVQASCTTKEAKEMWDNADKAEHRDFFIAGTIYGGAKDTKGGTWKASKVAFRDADTGKVVNVVWAVVYCLGKNDKGEDIAKGSLTRSFLLSEGRCQADGEVLAAKGDVRTWADENITDGVLKSEWTAKLAETLNTRGLIMVKDKYQQSKKEGGAFVATYMHPFFADTYTAE
jgi:hypothetical protein